MLFGTIFCIMGVILLALGILMVIIFKGERVDALIIIFLLFISGTRALFGGVTIINDTKTCKIGFEETFSDNQVIYFDKNQIFGYGFDQSDLLHDMSEYAKAKLFLAEKDIVVIVFENGVPYVLDRRDFWDMYENDIITILSPFSG